MADSVGIGFPTRNIQKGHIFYDLDERSTWLYIDGVPSSVASWKLLGGIFVNDPDTTLWNSDQTGSLWYNLSLNALRMWTGTAIDTVKDAAVPSSMYNYRNTSVLQDDFTCGFPTSTAIGLLGWSFSNGTTVGVAPEAGYPGIIRRSTSAVINTVSTLSIFGAARNFVSAVDWSMKWIVRLNNADADTLIQFGSLDTTSLASTRGVYFEKQGADTNWFGVTKSGGVQTRVNTGVVIDTGFRVFSIDKNSAGVSFSIDGVNVSGGRVATNVPTLSLFPVHLISNLIAADKTCDIDYFEMMIQVSPVRL